MRVLSIDSIKDTLRGVTVLVRSSLNVPLVRGAVASTFRLDAALPTIEFLSQHGARLVLLSHIGDAPTSSLRPVYDYLKTKIALSMVDDVVGPEARGAVHALKDGGVLMLENVRRMAGETQNDPELARSLASLGDIFVNDDFAAAHRSHASVVGVPGHLPSYGGLQFMAELQGLEPALNPKSPSIALVGGAKFVTKEPLIRALLPKYDHVFVGGALASDFFKAKGYEVGHSLVSATSDISDLLTNSKILLPLDVTVEGADGAEVRLPTEVHRSEIVYDIGPATVAMLAPIIKKAKTVMWNGPMGNFERGFRACTEELATMIAAAYGVSAVGGGDTIASIQKLGLYKKFEFVSTGGGAMLAYLAQGSLPGIDALENSKKLA